jgi:glucose/arabinose dehydrogenase
MTTGQRSVGALLVGGLLLLLVSSGPLAAANQPPRPTPAVAVAQAQPQACTEPPFNDVPTGHPFCPEIAWLKAEGITTGFDDGTYRPSSSVTRQAMAAFLARLTLAQPEACTEPPFNDVPISHPFCPEIAWLKAEGITTGFDDGTYRPSSSVTRQAMAAFLARLTLAQPEACTEPPFNDVPTGHPFCPEIAWLKDEEITTGFDDGTFRPANNVTRQAVAAFLYRTSNVIAPKEPPPVGFEPLASGFGGLTLLANSGDGSDRIFIVEQVGRIHAADTDGNVAAEAFLDIRDRVVAGGERGLLGLAFHPGFAQNGRLFVNYTDAEGDNIIAEFVAPAGGAADPASERLVVRIEQPLANHNGGMLAFGSDGMLYISSGDGGGGGDPLEAGQDRTTLLGKILRIDVDGDEPYEIPADNPFAGGAGGALPEIWAYGLRNPWRVSFDRQTGDLWIADVGQNRWEEVNAEPAGEGGRNYGWNVMEGPECYGQAECDTTGLTMPVAWYPTGATCAITGGYVYRGPSIPGLTGFYVYADYCSGDVWALDAAAALVATELPVEVHELGKAGIMVTGLGEDEAGDLYLVGAGGQVMRLIAAD